MKAAIYCRVSSEQQGKGFAGRFADEEGDDRYSLQTQRDECLAFAERSGWEVHDVYVELKSGYTILERPELNRLRDDMGRGAFQVVLVYALDRLSRNQRDQNFLYVDADHYGCRIESVTEDIEDTPLGTFQRAAIGFVAESERMKFIERSVRGRRARAQSGKFPATNRRMFGYNFTDDTKSALCINEDEYPWVRYIFEAAAEGDSARKIALHLQKNNVVNASGARFNSSSAVSNIIRHEIYTGKVYAFKWRQVTKITKDGRRVKRQELRPREEWIECPYQAPVIVDQTLWDKANAELKNQRKPKTRSNPKHDLILNGKGQAVCGLCGSTMQRVWEYSSHHKKPVRQIYRHNTSTKDKNQCKFFSLTGHTVDAEVWDFIVSTATEPDVLKEFLEESTKEDPTARTRAVLEQRLLQIKDEHSKQTRSFALVAADLDDITRAIMVEDIKSKSAEIAEIEADLQAAIEQHEAWKISQQSTDEMMLFLSALGERFTIDPPSIEEKRGFVTLLGVQVQMYPKGHELHPWRGSMTFGGHEFAPQQLNDNRTNIVQKVHLSFFPKTLWNQGNMPTKAPW